MAYVDYRLWRLVIKCSFHEYGGRNVSDYITDPFYVDFGQFYWSLQSFLFFFSNSLNFQHRHVYIVKELRLKESFTGFSTCKGEIS